VSHKPTVPLSQPLVRGTAGQCRQRRDSQRDTGGTTSLKALAALVVHPNVPTFLNTGETVIITFDEIRIEPFLVFTVRVALLIEHMSGRIRACDVLAANLGYLNIVIRPLMNFSGRSYTREHTAQCDR
jgi:hypothetical protein